MSFDPPALDLDKLKDLERQNAIMGRALTDWITRYYGLLAGFGHMKAEHVLPNVEKEAALLNASLQASMKAST